MTTIVEIKNSSLHGKGVFAKRNIAKGELIAECHMALVHVNENLPEVLATLQFQWTDEYDAICLSDVGSFFNHASQPSAEIVDRDFENLIQSFCAKTDISKGEEITIYYNQAFDAYIQD